MTNKRRVVVTGLGMVKPLGNTVDESWKNILAGKSGIAPLTHFDVSDYAVRFGGSIRDLDLSPYLSPKEARKMDTFMHYGMAAGIQAFEDSNLEVTEENATRIGVAIGSGTWRSARYREGHGNDTQQRAKKNISVLCSQQHHQHDLWQLVD